MEQFDRLNIKYTPAPIKNNLIDGLNDGKDSPLSEQVADLEIANKLLDHLKVVQDYRDRVSAIDYLINGADKLAGNPAYKTKKPDIIKDIELVGGHGDTVDFELFKKCVDVVIQGYKNMALISLTGVAND